MRTPRSRGVLWCVPLVALLSSLDARTPKSMLAQPVVSAATTLATARRQGKVNAGGIDWACSGTRCSTSTTLPTVAAIVAVCQGLAREVGEIGSFAVANRALTSSELKQCNSVLPASVAAMKEKLPVPATKPPVATASRSYPVSIRTEGLTVAGTGALTARLPFTPKNIRTEGLTVTGTGGLAALLPFTPKSIRTEVLTVTGTGVIR